MLPDRLKLIPSFCTDTMQTEIDRLSPDFWISNFVTQNFEGESRILPLREPKGAEHPVMMAYSDPTCESFEDTPFLIDCPYFQEVLKAFPFELHSVRLMALSPGSRINEHKDHDLAIELGAVRLHVPVRTDPDVEFYLNGTRVEMKEGECWYLRLSDPHRVYNGSEVNRVHLVIDAPASDAVAEFLQRSLG